MQKYDAEPLRTLSSRLYCFVIVTDPYGIPKRETFVIGYLWRAEMNWVRENVSSVNGVGPFVRTALPYQSGSSVTMIEPVFLFIGASSAPPGNARLSVSVSL